MAKLRVKAPPPARLYHPSQAPKDPNRRVNKITIPWPPKKTPTFFVQLRAALKLSHVADKSEARISKAVDKAMDKQNTVNGDASAGVSVRHGPVNPMNIDPKTNGTKRKSRNSITQISYKDDSDDEDLPLVSLLCADLGFQ